ncbi:hypothetical protein FRC17_011019 [Serendipita sp. 399]|nr:hypothetical protein FRC17_011019 [Serendipita sp. 399]
MPDHNGRDGSPTPRTPIPFGAQSRSSAGISGQYNVRSDAPSFIPLFHNFHLLQQGPTIAPVKAWPLQGASQSQDGSTQTLTLPSSNSLLQFVPQTATSPTPGSGSRATFGRPSTPSPLGMQQFLQQQAGTSNLSHTRYTPSPLHREARREESPAQETERLDILTRLQVQERLKILENVKRLTQHCIDELLLVRGGQLTTSELSRVGRNMEGRSSESSQASDSSIRVRAEPTLLVVPAPSSISGAASVPPVATPLLQPVASVEAVGDPTGLILATSPGHKDPSSILSNPDVISLSSAISSPVPTPPAESSPVLVTEMEATSSEETKANPLVTAQSSISEEIEKEQNSPVL